jgi:hypothetical protein
MEAWGYYALLIGVPFGLAVFCFGMWRTARRECVVAEAQRDDWQVRYGMADVARNDAIEQVTVARRDEQLVREKGEQFLAERDEARGVLRNVQTNYENLDAQWRSLSSAHAEVKNELVSVTNQVHDERESHRRAIAGQRLRLEQAEQRLATERTEAAKTHSKIMKNWEAFADEALLALSGAGIVTPEKGFIKGFDNGSEAAGEMGRCIRELAGQRDSWRMQTEAREKRLEECQRRAEAKEDLAKALEDDREATIRDRNEAEKALTVTERERDEALQACCAAGVVCERAAQVNAALRAELMPLSIIPPCPTHGAGCTEFTRAWLTEAELRMRPVASCAAVMPAMSGALETNEAKRARLIASGRRVLCAKGCCFECEACSAKPGSPDLCRECLELRALCASTGNSITEEASCGTEKGY